MTVKILLINGTEKTEQLVKSALPPLGCQIITASSTALGVFLARKNFPSLIIVGEREPDDSYQLSTDIKHDPDLSHIPVALIREKGLRLTGAVADIDLTMPLAPEQLITALKPYLVTFADNRAEETSE